MRVLHTCKNLPQRFNEAEDSFYLVTTFKGTPFNIIIQVYYFFFHCFNETASLAYIIKKINSTDIYIFMQKKGF